MTKTSKPLNARERQRAAVNAAMPDVKALVAKHGRSAVNTCLTRLKFRDKQAKALAKLRAEVSELEKQL